MSTDLELVSTEDLVAELKNRSRVFFLAIKRKGQPLQGDWSYDCGDDATVHELVGMVEEAKWKLLLASAKHHNEL